MKTLLQINTSLFADGQSSQLAVQFVSRWQATHPDGQVLVRNLTIDPVPHLTAERFAAFTTRPEARTPEQIREVAGSDVLIDELSRADVVVLGLPMYNFGIPSTLKAYFDHVARAGITFRYTENGPQGLLTGKRVYVFAARGGVYVGTPMDTQTTYVRNFLAFLGMQEVEFVYAEGLAMSDAQRTSALGTARSTLDALPL
jgi:FMN-dependent NADH-azoreductase